MLALLAAVCLFFGPFLLTGRVPFGGDLIMLNYPLLSMLHSTFVAGALPLWNPFSGGGAPLIPFSALVLYPATWLTAFLPATAAIGWTYILDFSVAGVFMVLLTRRMGASAVGSLVGALCFTFSGFMIVHVYAGHFLEIGVIAWMPALFYCAHSALATGRRVYMLAGGVCLGLQVLANGVEFLPFTLYPLLFVLLWYAVAFLSRAGRFSTVLSSLRQLVPPLLVAGVSAGGLSAVLALPFLQVLGRTLRSAGVPFADAAHLSLPYYALGMLALPNLFGNEADESYWLVPGEHLYFHELYAFVGIIPLAAAVFAWAGRQRSPFTLIYTVLALGGLVLALGHNTPVYQPIYELLPGLKLIRVPSRWLLVTTFAVAMLAAQGVDIILAGTYRGGRAALWLVGVIAGIFALCLGPLIVLIHVPALQGGFQQLPPMARMTMAEAVLRLGISLLLLCFLVLGRAHGAIGPRTLGMLVIALTCADLWSANGRFMRFIDPSPYFTGDNGSEVSAWLHGQPGAGNFRVLDVDHSLPLRAGMVDPTVRDVQDFAPMTLRDYWAYTHPQEARDMAKVSVTQSRAIISGYNAAVTRLLGVRYFITDRLITGPNLRLVGRNQFAPGFRHWYVPNGTSWNAQRWRALTYIYRDAAALPMFYYASRWAAVASANEAARLTRRGDVDLYRSPVLSPPTAAAWWRDLPWVRGVEALWAGWVATHDRFLSQEDTQGWHVRYGQNAVYADGFAPQDGVVVLNDIYYPGWIATVDGRQVPVERANYLLRGIRVTKGAHQIQFIYAPLSYLGGLLITLGTAGALMVGGLVWLLLRANGSLSEPRRRRRVRSELAPLPVATQGMRRLAMWYRPLPSKSRQPVQPPSLAVPIPAAPLAESVTAVSQRQRG